MDVYVIQRKLARSDFATFQFYDIYQTRDGAKSFVATRMKSKNREYDYRYTKRKAK